MKLSREFYVSLFCVFLLTVMTTLMISVRYDSCMVTEFYWWDGIRIEDGKIEVSTKRIQNFQEIRNTLDKYLKMAAPSPERQNFV